MAKEDKKQYTYNIIQRRGDPETAVTLSGDLVSKKETVVIPSPFDGTMVSLRCADYHNEHFVYIDPNYERDLPEGETRNFWFAMCTCGAPAAIISPSDANIHEQVTWIDRLAGEGIKENMLVCSYYFETLRQVGHGYHANQDKRKWT